MIKKTNLLRPESALHKSRVDRLLEELFIVSPESPKRARRFELFKKQ